MSSSGGRHLKKIYVGGLHTELPYAIIPILFSILLSSPEIAVGLLNYSTCSGWHHDALHSTSIMSPNIAMYIVICCGIAVYDICANIIGPGLPNALGEYDETPEIMSAHLKVSNWLRIIELQYILSSQCCVTDLHFELHTVVVLLPHPPPNPCFFLCL